jgi:hypothetical protein
MSKGSSFHVASKGSSCPSCAVSRIRRERPVSRLKAANMMAGLGPRTSTRLTPRRHFARIAFGALPDFPMSELFGVPHPAVLLARTEELTLERPRTTLRTLSWGEPSSLSEAHPQSPITMNSPFGHALNPGWGALSTSKERCHLERRRRNRLLPCSTRCIPVPLVHLAQASGNRTSRDQFRRHSSRS